MSRTVLNIGKAIEVKLDENQTIEDKSEQLLKERGIYSFDESCYDSALEHLQDEFYKEFINANGKLYQIIEGKETDEQDIFEATLNPDGSLNYILQYYNGGCSFSEALGYALKKLK